MQKSIELVRNFISNGIVLTKVGDGLYRCNCPFCKEEIASMFVSSSLQEYKCFSCGRNGNITNLYMELNHTDFFGAIKIATGKDADSSQFHEKNEVFFKMNIDAAKYFYKTLNSNAKAMEYWIKRGLSEDTRKKYGLGYASSFGLYDHLKNKYNLKDISKNGLIRSKEGKHYDFFYNRVIVPIIDENGRIIGFGGRVLDDSKPKYLNTGSTPIFDKRMHLFNLNIAKNTHRDGFILCEGYMDCIGLYNGGFDNAVASLGTALTEEQVHLLKHYTNHVYLCYDNDEAGKLAMANAYELCHKQGIFIKCIDLLESKDPDEFIKKYGSEAFEKQIVKASYYNG